MRKLGLERERENFLLRTTDGRETNAERALFLDELTVRLHEFSISLAAVTTFQSRGPWWLYRRPRAKQ
jgi:hypothetical protein